jgi:hypothetical protein
MKVKCIKLLDASGNHIEYSDWLVLGKLYHVLSVIIEPDGEKSLQILSSDRVGEWPNMGYHKAKGFDIVSNIIPSNWSVDIKDNFFIEIAPKPWHKNGFLESFYDREPEALEIFRREQSIIISEDP